MLARLVKPQLEELLRTEGLCALQEVMDEFDPSDQAEILTQFSLPDSLQVFGQLPPARMRQVFEYLPSELQLAFLRALNDEHLVLVLNGMAPDDRTRLVAALPPSIVARVASLLFPNERVITQQLLAYPEGTAGRLMTPRHVALQSEMSVANAIDSIRKQRADRETLSIVYVVNEREVLVRELRLAVLVLASPNTRVGDLEDRPLVSIPALMRRDEVVSVFRKYDRAALPVTDRNGRLLGIVTADDILDVATHEATEDIHKLGGQEAFDTPYLEIPLMQMIRKRAGWLTVLFLGEMLTATAMGFFEHEIARAVVLALFVPLIISSGGNSGSQSTSLVIRALAVKELALRDWWHVLRREVVSGVVLGAVLGSIGVVRILLWPARTHIYGAHYAMVALTVGLSLVGVVLFGSVAGAMLPFLLRRFGLDPATASAPFVATLVDVTGLVIYFSVASLVLRGVLL